MQRKEKPRSLLDNRLSFAQSFSYEVDAPLETVVHELAALEQEAQLFRRSSSHEMSLLPMGDHYVFRLRHRRHGTLTVSAEGEVRQDDNGCVIIEGETRVNALSTIGSLIAISLIGIGISLVSMPIGSRLILLVPFAISMLFGILMSFMMYRRDRNQLTSHFEEAVTHLNSHAARKEKRYPALELDEIDTTQEDSESILKRQEKRR